MPEKRSQTEIQVGSKKIKIAVDKKFELELTNIPKPNGPSRVRDSELFTFDENFDSIIQVLIELKESPYPNEFIELTPCIYDRLHLLLSYYYCLIIHSYMSINLELDNSIDKCFQAELYILKASTYIKFIQKDSKDIQQQIDTFIRSFILRLKKKHEENSREFLFKKYDPSAPDEIDTINDLMLANCKEIIEDINLAVNTINDFIDEISNTKKNNPILDNILSPIFASLLIELSPSLNQIENLK